MSLLQIDDIVLNQVGVGGLQHSLELLLDNYWELFGSDEQVLGEATELRGAQHNISILFRTAKQNKKPPQPRNIPNSPVTIYMGSITTFNRIALILSVVYDIWTPCATTGAGTMSNSTELQSRIRPDTFRTICSMTS